VIVVHSVEEKVRVLVVALRAVVEIAGRCDYEIGIAAAVRIDLPHQFGIIGPEQVPSIHAMIDNGSRGSAYGWSSRWKGRLRAMHICLLI
jgi:hypothetical protein